METLGYNARLSRFRTTECGNRNSNNYSVSFDGPLKIEAPIKTIPDYWIIPDYKTGNNMMQGL